MPRNPGLRAGVARRAAAFAKLMVEPADARRAGVPDAVDEHRTLDAAAWREVIEHLFAADPAHDAVVSMADDRLVEREAEAAAFTSAVACQLELVRSVAAFAESVAVEVQVEAFEVHLRVAFEQS